MISAEVKGRMGTVKDGALGENIAADYLRLRGYKILKRNYRVRHLEIDLIARDKNCLVFIEVKTRKNYAFGRAIESLPSWKILNIRRAAQYYIVHQGEIPGICEVRLDFVAIDIDCVCDKMILQHIKGVA